MLALMVFFLFSLPKDNPWVIHHFLLLRRTVEPILSGNHISRTYFIPRQHFFLFKRNVSRNVAWIVLSLFLFVQSNIIRLSDVFVAINVWTYVRVLFFGGHSCVITWQGESTRQHFGYYLEHFLWIAHTFFELANYFFIYFCYLFSLCFSPLVSQVRHDEQVLLVYYINYN